MSCCMLIDYHCKGLKGWRYIVYFDTYPKFLDTGLYTHLGTCISIDTNILLDNPSRPGLRSSFASIG